MSVARAEAIQGAIDELLEATRETEQRLEQLGEPAAHDWMFALREVLLDLRRVLPAIATLSDLPDREAAAELMRELAGELAHGVAPHMIHHMQQVLDGLDEHATAAEEG
jgi:hypothetical protein